MKKNMIAVALLILVAVWYFFFSAEGRARIGLDGKSPEPSAVTEQMDALEDENVGEVAASTAPVPGEFPFQKTSEDGQYTLALTKETFAPEEKIYLQVSALSGILDATAWVGMIPSSVERGDEERNDQFDIEYHYITEGNVDVFEFTAPSDPGSYDFRLHSSDDNAVAEELFFTSFRVNAQ